MPICISGMPFSGTSLVARVLRDLGLDLGPDEDRFESLNDEILLALGAAWDLPPANDDGGWARSPQLEPLRQRAAAVSEALALAEPWGWADPRNALTLPFWRELFPDLQVVVCVRDPQEVAGELEASGLASYAGGLRLWHSYYEATLDPDDERTVVTHHARLREEPPAEVERLATAVGLKPSRSTIRRVVASLSSRPVREERLGEKPELPPDVQELYRMLLEASVSRAQPKAPRSTHGTTDQHKPAAGDVQDALAAQQLELEHVRLELGRWRGYSEALQTEIDARAAADVDLGDVIHNLEQQLLERDEEIASLRADLRRRLHAEDALHRKVDELEEKLGTVEPTLLWRLGTRYWALKEQVRRRFRGRRS